MKIFRNTEFVSELAVFAVLGTALGIAGFFVSPLCGILLTSSGLVFTAVFIWFSARRYRYIEKLSQEIDRILHGQQQALVTSEEEGEFSILCSEISKMTVRIKEQNDRLKDEKLRLTGAIEDIFHQMRTPLTSMALTVSLLGRETLSEERRRELLHDLKKQNEKMAWLVETLLKMSKIDAGTAVFNPKRIPVRELINKASEPLLITMELRSLSFSADDGGACLFADPDFTAEALANVIKNCAEHTPGGGRIQIRAKETALYTEIVVEDSGSGFDKADLPRIFERFYKGKNAGEGSIGIGLAFARAVVTAQNGTLTAENGKNGGARFVFKFYKSVV